MRDSLILGPDDVRVIRDDDTTVPGPDKHARLVAIHERIVATQALLDAKKFRTLHELGSQHTSMGSEQPPSTRGPEPIYADIVDTSVTIVDATAARKVLWRGSFYVNPLVVAIEECTGWTPWSMTLWWDPTTRFVLAEQTYRTGGSCLCPDLPAESVRRMRR